MSTILFTELKPNVYHISQIYDSETNPLGQVIPQINSIIIDNENALRKVSAVNETTYNCTLVPLKTLLVLPDEVVDDAPDDSYIVDYGNTRFFMYYDTSVTPTKLCPDAKIIVIGNSHSYFQVWRELENGTQEKISLYYDQDGIFQGYNIPLIVATGKVNIKYLTNCHTNKALTDNDIVHFKIFDYAGTQTGDIVAHAKRAIVQNNINELIIEDFVLRGSQELGDAFYLYAGQDYDNLVISPTLIYNNGREDVVPIDELICHSYSDLQDFIPAYPGQEVDVLVKYFLAPEQEALNPTVLTNGVRFLSATKKIVVLRNNEYEYVTKISVIPKWISGLNYYKLYFYLYTLGDNTVRDITNDVVLLNPFNGQDYNTVQLIQMQVDLSKFFPISPLLYDQNCQVQLRINTVYEKYIITDSPGDVYGVFGVETPTTKRPIIMYNPTTMQYFVPTSKFNSISEFLESFYFKARPLYNQIDLNGPPTPSHFTLRDISTNTILLTSPIPVDSYQQGFSIIGSPVSRLTNSNIIVEFLKYTITDGYSVIYGVPVDVIYMT